MDDASNSGEGGLGARAALGGGSKKVELSNEGDDKGEEVEEEDDDDSDSDTLSFVE